jgi:hypothetical protein
MIILRATHEMTYGQAVGCVVIGVVAAIVGLVNKQFYVGSQGL